MQFINQPPIARSHSYRFLDTKYPYWNTATISSFPYRYLNRNWKTKSLRILFSLEFCRDLNPTDRHITNSLTLGKSILYNENFFTQNFPPLNFFYYFLCICITVTLSRSPNFTLQYQILLGWPKSIKLSYLNTLTKYLEPTSITTIQIQSYQQLLFKYIRIFG